MNQRSLYYTMSFDPTKAYDPTKQGTCAMERCYPTREVLLCYPCTNKPVCAFYHKGKGQLFEYCEKHKSRGPSNMMYWDEKTGRYE